MGSKEGPATMVPLNPTISRATRCTTLYSLDVAKARAAVTRAERTRCRGAMEQNTYLDPAAGEAYFKARVAHRRAYEMYTGWRTAYRYCHQAGYADRWHLIQALRVYADRVVSDPYDWHTRGVDMVPTPISVRVDMTRYGEQCVLDAIRVMRLWGYRVERGPADTISIG